MIGKYFGFACEMRLLKPQEIFQDGDNQIQVIAIVHAGRVCSYDMAQCYYARVCTEE
jgi:hypothetical protein